MTLMFSEAYARGREAARHAGQINLLLAVQESLDSTVHAYPELRDTDLAAAILHFDRERMANPPDPLKYPETEGLADIVRAERQGFLDEVGGNELLLAYHYSWSFYGSRRIMTRYLPLAPAQRAECTAVFLRDSVEGGPLFGRNWDVPLTPWAHSLMEPPREAGDGQRKMFIKGVSASIFLDDEPEELFPVDPFLLLPTECSGDVSAAVDFLYRYRDFWGPGNHILIDTQLNSVAIEKANVRMGVRSAVNGASAVTALSYQTPELKEYKLERDLLSIQKRGWTTENAPDWIYWRGADARYLRLLSLVEEASKHPATLQEMAAIVTDHAVPYPACVCLAGQTCVPGVTVEQAEWTAVSHSEVLEGPHRRMLFYVAEDGKACYNSPPYLVPGQGVNLKAEWQVGTRPLPAAAHHPRPRIHADHPNIRVML